MMVEYLISKDHLPNRRPSLQRKRIDCDVSNILHLLSYRHSKIFSSTLVRDVALFLKQLASDTGYIVTAVLDGHIRPQSKRDAYHRHYESTTSRIDRYFCRQYAMKIASKGKDKISADEKNMLDLYNNEAKLLEDASKMQIPLDFKAQLELALDEVGAYLLNRESGGCVSKEVIQAEFETDYMIAYQFRNGLTDIIFSTDSDISVFCGPT